MAKALTASAAPCGHEVARAVPTAGRLVAGGNGAGGFLRRIATMLVLSRFRDETLMIGDDVEITVVDIRGEKVRLGITAPREIPVHRKEVWAAIKREEEAAKEG